MTRVGVSNIHKPLLWCYGNILRRMCTVENLREYQEQIYAYTFMMSVVKMDGYLKYANIYPM